PSVRGPPSANGQDVFSEAPVFPLSFCPSFRPRVYHLSRLPFFLQVSRLWIFPLLSVPAPPWIWRYLFPLTQVSRLWSHRLCQVSVLPKALYEFSHRSTLRELWLLDRNN